MLLVLTLVRLTREYKLRQKDWVCLTYFVAAWVSGKMTVSRLLPMTVSDLLGFHLAFLIIRGTEGNRTTPSYVAFSTEERLIGDAAKNQAAMNPRNTIFDAKRLIGRRYEYVSLHISPTFVTDLDRPQRPRCQEGTLAS